MSKKILIFLLVLISVSSLAKKQKKASPEQDWAEKKQNPMVFWQDKEPIPFKGENPLAKALGKPLKNGGFKMDGHALWCPSIIKVGDTYHMFVSHWVPKQGENSIKGWRGGNIARATSKYLLGPYKFQEIVLKPRTGEDFYDSFGVHNPKIIRHEGKFILYYIMIPSKNFKKSNTFKNGIGGYQTGIATADSIDGAWERCDKPIAPMNNPTLWIHDDGSIFALGKDKKLRNSAGRAYCRMYSLVAKSLKSPYYLVDNLKNALPNGYEHEDACIWFANGQYNILVNDWKTMSYLPGKPLLYYFSTNGVKFHLFSDKPVIPEGKVTFDDGSSEEFIRKERPNIYINEKNEVEAIMFTGLKDYNTNPYIIVVPVNNFYPKNKHKNIISGNQMPDNLKKLLKNPSESAYIQIKNMLSNNKIKKH